MRLGPLDRDFCRIRAGVLRNRQSRSIVERSTTATDWVDGMETGWRDRTSPDGADLQDHFQHLAKVRVAGSNPVFRSNKDPVIGQQHDSLMPL